LQDSYLGEEQVKETVCKAKFISKNPIVTTDRNQCEWNHKKTRPKIDNALTHDEYVSRCLHAYVRVDRMDNNRIAGY